MQSCLDRLKPGDKVIFAVNEEGVALAKQAININKVMCCNYLYKVYKKIYIDNQRISYLFADEVIGIVKSNDSPV